MRFRPFGAQARWVRDPAARRRARRGREVLHRVWLALSKLDWSDRDSWETRALYAEVVQVLRDAEDRIASEEAAAQRREG